MKKHVEVLRVKLHDDLYGPELKKTRDDIKAVRGVFNLLSYGGALNSVVVEYDGRMATAADVRRVRGVERVVSPN
jgi:hypothetical protein